MRQNFDELDKPSSSKNIAPSPIRRKKWKKTNLSSDDNHSSDSNEDSPIYIAQNNIMHEKSDPLSVATIKYSQYHNQGNSDYQMAPEGMIHQYSTN